MTWFRVGSAAVLLFWVLGVLAISLCRAAAREDTAQAEAYATHKHKELQP